MVLITATVLSSRIMTTNNVESLWTVVISENKMLITPCFIVWTILIHLDRYHTWHRGEGQGKVPQPARWSVLPARGALAAAHPARHGRETWGRLVHASVVGFHAMLQVPTMAPKRSLPGGKISCHLYHQFWFFKYWPLRSLSNWWKHIKTIPVVSKLLISSNQRYNHWYQK